MVGVVEKSEVESNQTETLSIVVDSQSDIRNDIWKKRSQEVIERFSKWISRALYHLLLRADNDLKKITRKCGETGTLKSSWCRLEFAYFL